MRGQLRGMRPGKFPPRGLLGVAFWLAVCFLVLALLRLLPGEWSTLFYVLQWMVGIALFGVAIPLVLRFVRNRLLWSLRSRLVLTYLLFGLAPGLHAARQAWPKPLAEVLVL